MNPKGLNEYREKLLLSEQTGGTLYCEDGVQPRRKEFNTCRSFSDLQERGCFGFTTIEIRLEIDYAELCETLEILRYAKVPRVSYFDTNSMDWWKNLPAEIIPMPGGVYNNQTWEKEKKKREELVSGKLLGQLNLDQIIASKESVAMVIDSTINECGKVHDYLKITPVLLGDFDDDGVAEFMLSGERYFQSETCVLGTGNRIGSEFNVLIKKEGASAQPTVIQR